MGKKVHFLGIGGSGASAAAAIAEAQGFEVTGCDLNPHNEFTTQFKKSQLLPGHSANHLYCHPEVETSTEGSSTTMEDSSLIARNDKNKNRNGGLIDILAVTPAIFSLDPKNPELLAAKENNIPIMTWQNFTGEYLAKGKFVIAVCGTHGKTTTTAMIAKMLEDNGLDPTVLLGAIVPEWGTNYRIPSYSHPELDSGSIQNRFRIKSGMTKRGYFVLEADEFNDNFLPTKPDIAVVTNIEMDHPEYFKDLTAVKKSFQKFLKSTKQKIIANLSDPVVKQVLSVHPKGVNLIIDYSKKLIEFLLQIPGDFNVMNASAAFQVGLALGIAPENIKKSLQNYQGVGRRFEYIGQYKGAKVYSDFGHHPTEIKATMEAVRQKFPNQKVLLIYQPHMFSRTKTLFNEFVEVFRHLPIDKTFILDIYPSREVDTGLVTSKQLVDTINRPSVLHPGRVTETEVSEKIKPEIKKGDIVFFMGAGDIDKLAKELVG